MPKPGRGGGGRGGGRNQQRARQEPGRDRERQREDAAKRGEPAKHEQRATPEQRGKRDEPAKREQQRARTAQRGKPGGGAPARDKPGGQDPERPPRDPRQPERRAAPPPPKVAPSVEVGATQNKPELVETIPITPAPGTGQVVLSLGPDTKTETPLPDLVMGDRLLAFAELELTTDAEDPKHPGLIGNAYSYAPGVTARLLLAPSAGAVDGGIELASPWSEAVTHQRHHAVVTFGDAEARIPPKGLPWKGQGHVNLVVDASHPDAQPGDVLLVGQNEKTPTVVQDMAGIRVVRFRPGDAREPSPETQETCLRSGIPIAKQETVVLSHELAGLQEGERLLVRGTLVTDAAGLAAPARISTRLFVAEGPDQTDPGGEAAAGVTWKGHLSKFTGFNCIPGEGPRPSRKYGVAIVRRAPGRSLYVNLVAVSAAPFGGNAPTDELPVDTGASSLRVTRFPAVA